MGGNTKKYDSGTDRRHSGQMELGYTPEAVISGQLASQIGEMRAQVTEMHRMLDRLVRAVEGMGRDG